MVVVLGKLPQPLCLGLDPLCPLPCEPCETPELLSLCVSIHHQGLTVIQAEHTTQNPTRGTHKHKLTKKNQLQAQSSHSRLFII